MSDEFLVKLGGERTCLPTGRRSYLFNFPKLTNMINWTDYLVTTKETKEQDLIIQANLLN